MTVKQTISFFDLMIPPTATHQEKKFTARHGRIVAYDPPEVKDARAKLLAYVAKHRPDKPMTGPVTLTAAWHFPITDGHGDGEPKTTQERFGHIPLPPYLNRDAEKEDTERYQTVYASQPGAVAAPTAGLHFTPEILNGARNKGVAVAELTLHVGPGTFKPVSAEYAEEHKMHFEEFILPTDVATLANTTRNRGNKVLAVGTTTVRVLESCCDSTGFLTPRSGRTDIFLHPPYKAVSADMLLTNFHLPCSTLLMLVSCFCEREMVIAAYRKAVENKMRFYSYGDCMLLK